MDHYQRRPITGRGNAPGTRTPDEASAEDDPEPGAGDGLLELVLDSPEITTFLTELTVMTASCLSTRDSIIQCGVTIMRGKKPATVASSDARAMLLDELQNGFGYGPCLTAMHEDTTTLIPDLLVEERWHRYTEAALDFGVRSILAVPLNLDGEGYGVTNLYSRSANRFSDVDVRTARNFVATASRSLMLALTMARLRVTTADELAAARQSRTIIDMALGLIMAQNNSSQDEAIRILTTPLPTRAA